ncbi:MAG: hypothetical protein FJW63_10585 [Actinobacteria bacterium]|nr:hypothetical protein [Actinomycetota bacterium]
MEKKLIRKDVYFDLPFLISVKDGFRDPTLDDWFEAYQKGNPLPFSKYAPHNNEPSTTVIGGGCPVYIPPDEKVDPYILNLPEIKVTTPETQIKIPETQVKILFLRHVNPNTEVKVIGELIGDRNGKISFSSVLVKIDINIVKPEYYWDMNLFLVIALFAINTFIENYRVIADRPYIRPVTAAEIQQFHLRTLFEDGTYQWAQLKGVSGPLYGFGYSISDDKDKDLRKALLEDNSPSMDKILDVEIRNYLDLNEWRLALIESAVLFEAWLSTYLRQEFKDKGLNESEIKKKS